MTEPKQALITLGAPLSKTYTHEEAKIIIRDTMIAASGDNATIKAIKNIRPVIEEHFKHNKTLGPFNTTRGGIADNVEGVKRSGLTDNVKRSGLIDNVKGLDKKPDNGDGQELKPQPVALIYGEEIVC